MRQSGVRGLDVTCQHCGYHTVVNVDRWREDVPFPSLGPRMRCTKCGKLGATATLMPTPRSGHGGVFYNGKLFCMGGEGTRRVSGELEAYDPRADTWQAYAQMPAPRHGMGARY
jgi:hypothetical protein